MIRSNIKFNIQIKLTGEILFLQVTNESEGFFNEVQEE
jgi:hypothetical protein